MTPVLPLRSGSWRTGHPPLRPSPDRRRASSPPPDPSRGQDPDDGGLEHGDLLLRRPVAGGLGTGDAVRCTATGGQRITATEAAEVLVWERHAAVAA